jgi:hypothetical protein
MDLSSQTQNRRSRRSNVLLAATLELSGQALPVKLRNLSAEGALVEAEKLPVEGSQLLFRRNDLAVQARVCWVAGHHAGLAFAEPLEAQVVLRHVPSPRPRMQPEFRRPGLACRALSPEERRLIESWIVTPPQGQLGD